MKAATFILLLLVLGMQIRNYYYWQATIDKIDSAQNSAENKHPEPDTLFAKTVIIDGDLIVNGIYIGKRKFNLNTPIASDSMWTTDDTVNFRPRRAMFETRKRNLKAAEK